MKEYSELIGQAQKGYADLMQVRTKAAIEHLGLDEAQFIGMVQAIMTEPEY